MVRIPPLSRDGKRWLRRRRAGSSGPRVRQGEVVMRDVVGKVAVVTGGGQGIGRAMVERFGAEGMKVVLADIVPALVEATTGELVDRGLEVTGVVTDVTALESVEALRDATIETYGAVHLLCNNAGIGSG